MPALKLGSVRARYRSFWDHGNAYDTAGDEKDHYWRCCYYQQVITIQNHITTPAIRHLQRKHSITSPSTLIDDISTRSDSASTIGVSSGSEYRTLFTTVNRPRFRLLLLHFIVSCNLPFITVENEEFRKLIETIAPSLKGEVPSSRTICRLLVDEFEGAKIMIQELFTTSKSQIHISYDIWTSPNGLAFLGVIAHWLGYDSSVWMVLPILDSLLTHCESGLQSLGVTPTTISRKSGRKQDLPTLAISYQNAWQKLTEYYKRTDDDDHSYAAATLYNPALRKQYFNRCWGQQWGNAKEAMIQRVWDMWNSNYRAKIPPEPIQPSIKKLSFLQQWTKKPIHSDSDTDASGDEF